MVEPFSITGRSLRDEVTLAADMFGDLGYRFRWVHAFYETYADASRGRGWDHVPRLVANDLHEIPGGVGAIPQRNEVRPLAVQDSGGTSISCGNPRCRTASLSISEQRSDWLSSVGKLHDFEHATSRIELAGAGAGVTGS